MEVKNNLMNKCKTTALKFLFFYWHRDPFRVPHISLVVSLNTFMQILVSIKNMKQNYMKK